MTIAACSTVIASATTHAYWNLLLKRAGSGHALVAVSKIIEAALLIPVLLLSYREWPQIQTAWMFPIVGAILVGVNYVATTVAYQRTDFSLAYPTARGAVLLFLPPLSFLLLGEHIDWIGAAALIIIVGAIALLPLQDFDAPSFRRLITNWRTPGMGFAWTAALSNAGYTLCSAYAMRALTPFTYFASYTVLLGSGYAASSIGDRTVGMAWKQQWHIAGQVAIFNTISYVLMLQALRTGHTSYVTGLRQFGIAIGAVFGWWLLGEKLSWPRRVGLVLLVSGCVGVAFAR